MIDTVKFGLEEAKWAAEFDSSLKVSEGTKTVRTLDGNVPVSSWRCVQCDLTGLRVYGTQNYVHSVEVSLPKLVYGENGILLREWHLADAWAILKAKTLAISPQTAFLKLLRVDLVWQFDMKIEHFIAAYRNIKHPKIRTRANEYFGTGLEWVGDKIKIRAYDKVAEIGKGCSPGNFLRFEVQLRGKAMPAIWDVENGFDFLCGYAYYRRLVKGFEPRPVTKPASLPQFLAWLIKHSPIVGGERVLDVALRSKSDRQGRRIRTQVLAVKVPQVVCDIAGFLHEDKLPNYHDVHAPGVIEEEFWGFRDSLNLQPQEAVAAD